MANYRVVLRLKNKERIVCGFEDFLSAKVFKQACLDLLYSTKIVDINLVYSNGMKTPKDKPKGEHPFGLYGVHIVGLTEDSLTGVITSGVKSVISLLLTSMLRDLMASMKYPRSRVTLI